MIKDYFLDSLIDIVKKNKGDREVVLWGPNEKLINALSNTIDINGIYTANNELRQIHTDYLHPEVLLRPESKEKYYIIMSFMRDPSNNKGADQVLLERNGYVEYRDFCFYRKQYFYGKNGVITDDMNNSISIPDRVHLTLFGRNNEIVIDNSVKIASNSRLYISVNGFYNRIIIKNGTIHGDARIVVGNNCLLSIKEGFDFGRNLEIEMGRFLRQKIVIDSNMSFSSSLILSVQSGGTIEIGEDVMFSHDCIVQAGDGHSIYDVTSGKRMNVIEEESGKVKIGDHVWIGRKAMILGGVRYTEIGDGSIVGAGTVFKGKSPNNVVVAGNPAKIVRKDIAWSRTHEDCFDACGKWTNLTDN